MTTEYYNHSSYPSTGAAGSSALMRAELKAVEDGFAKLPALSGKSGKVVIVDSSATALDTSDAVVIVEAADAVNIITLTSAAAAAAPSLAATGSDTNISLNLVPKGTGIVAISGGVTAGGVEVPTISSTSTLTNKTYADAVFTKSVTEGVVSADSGTSYTINLDNGTIIILTLTGNLGTFNFPTATAGRQFTLILTQDATGSRTVTWPDSVRWPSSSTPTHTATASKTDVFSFIADGTYWLGGVGGRIYTRA